MFLSVTLFRQKKAEKRYTICILLRDNLVKNDMIIEGGI